MKKKISLSDLGIKSPNQTREELSDLAFDSWEGRCHDLQVALKRVVEVAYDNHDCRTPMGDGCQGCMKIEKLKEIVNDVCQ